MGQAQGMAKFVGRYCNQIYARRRQVNRPGLGFIKVCITSESSTTGRRVISVCQNPAWPIEIISISVIAAGKTNHDVGFAVIATSENLRGVTAAHKLNACVIAALTWAWVKSGVNSL